MRIAPLLFAACTAVEPPGEPVRTTPVTTPATSPVRPAAELTVEILEPQAVPFDAMPDRYASIVDACIGEVRDQIPEKWRAAALRYCDHRSYHSSRYQTVVSRVDGSQIHDRDRPSAWKFYLRGAAVGWLDPDNCPHHRVETGERHPASCRKLARDWPFSRPTMTDRMRSRWHAHPHDMERFGARGPHDHNARAYQTVPGCWPPERLERNDWAAYVTVKKIKGICEKAKRCTFNAIREAW